MNVEIWRKIKYKHIITYMGDIQNIWGKEVMLIWTYDMLMVKQAGQDSMYKQLHIDEPRRMLRNKLLSSHQVPGPCLELWIEWSWECCLCVVTISCRRNMCRMKKILSLNQLWEEQEKYENGWLTNKDDPGEIKHMVRGNHWDWKQWTSYADVGNERIDEVDPHTRWSS